MRLSLKKAYHKTVDGEVTEISPHNAKHFSLEEVQGKVEGYIEIVYLSEKQIMIVNENGKFDKEYNPVATTIADLHNALWVNDYICGDVVICPANMLT